MIKQSNSSLFNQLKWQLVVLTITGLLLLLAVNHITPYWFYQFLLLSSFSILSFVWIIWRAQRLIIKQHLRQSDPAHEPFQE